MFLIEFLIRFSICFAQINFISASLIQNIFVLLSSDENKLSRLLSNATF